MELIQQAQGRMAGWVKNFEPKNLKDKDETVFITIATFKNKTSIVGIAAAQVNWKDLVYLEYADGMILDKESSVQIVKISRQDNTSPDEEIFLVTVVAESKYDADMVSNHITNCLMELLREKHLLK